jgi:oxygen-independent coproporphyrinogen-3 oxidase
MVDEQPPMNIGLLKKYDTPGPRYTSYPSAPLFSPAFQGEDYTREILNTNTPKTKSALSLYFHFPFCDTLCYFCGCTMMVTRDRERLAEYLRYLKKEIGVVAPMIADQRRVNQIHWGGGTPTHMTPEEILDIGAHIRKSFRLAADAELSVEVDPRELTQRHLGALRQVGFNRISIGVQDFNERVQKAVNRIQPKEVTIAVVKSAATLGFDSLNIDLIYGLPHQTVASFKETLDEVIALGPDRIAVFNYAHVPWLKPHQKLISESDLPSPSEKLRILMDTIDFLASEGYEYIGMDHFAKPEDELSVARKQRTLYRNFQGYSTRAGADLYGFGMSSISHFGNIYAQNAKSLQSYYAALDSGVLPTAVGYRMNEDDRIRKSVIMRLMCDLELDKKSIEQEHGIRFDEYFSTSLLKLNELVSDDLVELFPDRIVVSRSGRFVLRNIAMCFDAYLDAMSRSKPTFSRTV